MGEYELWLTRDTGARLALLDNALWWQCSRTLNGIGMFTMGLPAGFDEGLLKVDQMVQVWRAPEGGRPALWRTYFLRAWRWEGSQNEEQLTIWGPDLNHLFWRRCVAYRVGSSQAQKSDLADDMMKAIVDENLINSTSTDPAAVTRDYAQLGVALDWGAGPTVEKGFAWRKVDGLLADLGAAAAAAGTEVFFEIAATDVGGSEIALEFRTYPGLQGQDRTESVTFDPEAGNLADPWLEENYMNEVNAVYGLGQGQEDDREVQVAEDAARQAASIWNRCEATADARNDMPVNGVLAAAQAALTEGKPKVRFGGRAMDTAGTRFQRDWDFGDLVRARYRGREFDCMVRAVQLAVGQNGTESIEARLYYES